MNAEQVRDALFEQPSTPLDPYKIGPTLAKFWKEHREQHPERADMRVCIQNLLLICNDPSRLEGLGQPLQELATVYPGRTVMVVLDPDDTNGEMVGWYRIEEMGGRHSRPGGELVGLYAPVDPAAIHSLLAPTWQDGVPVVLWWMGQPPYNTPYFENLVEGSSRVIVNTGGFSTYPTNPHEAFEILKGLGRYVFHPYHQDQSFCDQTWGRLGVWREWVAGLFDREEDQALLEQLETLEIVFWASPGKCGISLLALYLAGWLTRQFRWGIDESLQSTECGWTAKLRTKAGHPFQLKLQSQPSLLEDRPLRLKSVSFKGKMTDGQAFEMGIERAEEMLFTLVRRSRIPGRELPDHALQHRRLTRRELVEIQLGSFGHDFVFEGALQLAIDLLGSGESAE